jgi:hypothetical protein
MSLRHQVHLVRQLIETPAIKLARLWRSPKEVQTRA